MKNKQLFKTTKREIANDLLRRMYEKENYFGKVMETLDNDFEKKLFESKRNQLDHYWEMFVHTLTTDDTISWINLSIDVWESVIEECQHLNPVLNQVFDFELNRWRKLLSAAIANRN